MTSFLPYWLACLYWPGVGIRTVFKLLKQFKNIQELFTASDAELIQYGLSARQANVRTKINWQQVDIDLNWAQNVDNHLICWEAIDDYPELLRHISDPPLVLFVRGNKNILNSKQLSIVGARFATQRGMSIAHEFASALTNHGFTITSGLAAGIDGAAHRGALAAGGKTIAICGTGLINIYPLQHKNLAYEIIESAGALVSEFPLATLPLTFNFPRRNRILGAISLGTLVVEATLKSGSLISANYALEQGREVFAIPGSIHDPMTKGCHHLIRNGAKLVETIYDIIEEFTMTSKINCTVNCTAEREHLHLIKDECKITKVVKCTDNINRLVATANLAPEQQAIYNLIDFQLTPLDIILLRSGLNAQQVTTTLLVLELEGFIQAVPGGYIRIS